MQAGGKDAGACSGSGPCCWGWQHGQEAECPAPSEEGCSVMATPWFDEGAALCFGWLLSLALGLHQIVLHLHTNRRTGLTTPAVLEANFYLFFSTVLPQNTLLVTASSSNRTEAEWYFFPTHYFNACKIQANTEIYYLGAPTFKISSMEWTSLGKVCYNKKRGKQHEFVLFLPTFVRQTCIHQTFAYQRFYKFH